MVGAGKYVPIAGAFEELATVSDDVRDDPATPLTYVVYVFPFRTTAKCVQVFAETDDEGPVSPLIV